jgi:hypothetical protein
MSPRSSTSTLLVWMAILQRSPTAVLRQRGAVFFVWEEGDITIRHPVEFSYTRQELEALFRLANEGDVEKGGRCDARSAAINIWSHHWQERAAWEESDTIGTFYFHWEPTPMLYEIQPDEGFSLEDLLQELGRLELQALGYVKHGDVPRGGLQP